MQITKRQSFIIAGGTIALFFVVGGLFLRTGSKGMRIAEQSSATASSSSVAASTPDSITASNETPVPSSSEGALASGIFTINEFHRSEILDGRKLWEVHGEKAQLFPENGSVIISNADLSMFQKNGKETDLTTKQATIFMSGPTLTKAHLQGGVKVVFDHQYTLTSEEAFCDRVANTISIPTPLMISGEAMEISGRKLDGAIDSQEFTISGDVVTLIKPGAKKPAELQ